MQDQRIVENTKRKPFKEENLRIYLEKMGKRCQEGCEPIAIDRKLKCNDRQKRGLEEEAWRTVVPYLFIDVLVRL